MSSHHLWPRSIHVVLQCSLVFIIVTFFLFFLGNFVLENKLIGIVGASSLGSTAFVVFVTKNSHAAQYRSIILGYLFSICIGLVGHHILNFLDAQSTGLNHEHLATITAGAVMVIVIILMVLFRAIHPPAAGFCIVLIIAHWTAYNLLTLVVTVFLIIVLRYFLDPWLIDLS